MKHKQIVSIPKAQASEKMIDYLTIGLSVDFEEVGVHTNSAGDKWEISAFVLEGDFPKNITAKMRRAVSAFFKDQR